MSRFAVIGANGQTGGATARALVEAGHALRVVLRDPAKGAIWANAGAEVVAGDVGDAASLIGAFRGCDAAFLMNPPAYTAEDPFQTATLRAESFARALDESDLSRAVLLSSFSAHLAAGNGMIHSNHVFEQRLETVSKPVTFLRPGYFLENWAAVREPVLKEGILPTMLLPHDRAIPMVAVADIGAVAAKLLTETWQGRRIVELAGPTSLSPEGVAAILTRLLGRTITTVSPPREDWAGIIGGDFMSPAAATALAEMFDGFNDGTIRFQGAEPRRGATRHEDVLRNIFIGKVSE